MDVDVEIENTLKEVEKDSRLAPISGGTVSSYNLRGCLSMLRAAKTPDHRKRIQKQIEIWRQALRRHNAQPQKVFEYNLETGEPIEEESHAESGG